MKKQLLFLLPACLLLASCGGTSDAVPIDDEQVIDSTSGVSKLDAIEDNLVENLGDRCATIAETVESGDFAITYGNASMTANYKSSTEAKFDIPDNELYLYNAITFSISGDNTAIQSTTEQYVYSFDGQYAQKTVSNDGFTTETNRTVLAQTVYASTMYEATVSAIIATLTNGEWTNVVFYGNSNDYDLRIVAEGDNSASCNVTFVDGLLTNFVMTQTADFSTLVEGMTGTFTATDKVTFTYSDSLDITHPDLSAEEW